MKKYNFAIGLIILFIIANTAYSCSAILDTDNKPSPEISHDHDKHDRGTLDEGVYLYNNPYSHIKDLASGD
jgi:hypothetical protein